MVFCIRLTKTYIILSIENSEFLFKSMIKFNYMYSEGDLWWMDWLVIIQRII